MKIETLNFGEIEIEAEEVIAFPQGIPGYEEMSQFAILHPDKELPFSYLQSVEMGQLCFIIVDPFIFHPAYEFQLPDSVVELLGIEDEQEILVRAIVTSKGELKDATMNLLAPVVINTRSCVAKQVILGNTPYGTKYRLFPQQSDDTEVNARVGAKPYEG